LARAFRKGLRGRPQRLAPTASDAAAPFAAQELIVEIGFRPLDRRELVLDLSQPSEVGLAFLVGKRAFGRPKFPM
jgi:hypothetical protein